MDPSTLVPGWTHVSDEDMNMPLEVIMQMDDPLFDPDFIPDGMVRVILEHLDTNPEALIASADVPTVPPALSNANAFRRYWSTGPGGAKIQWNKGSENSDWARCVRNLTKYIGPRAQGFCTLRKKEMSQSWAGNPENKATIHVESGKKVFSTDVIVPEAEFFKRAQLRTNIQYAKDRIKGLTADAYPQAMDPTRAPGSAFIIPLGLPIGVESGDSRVISDSAEVSARDLPLPLLWQINTAGGHDGSVVVGRIDSMDITPFGVKDIRGVFDNGVYGAEAERLVREGFLRGVSADMDRFEAQEMPVLAADDPEDSDDPDAEPTVTIAKQQIVINKTRIMAFTIVAKPAFQECQIFLEDNLPPTDEENIMIPDGIYVEDADPVDAAALVAAGYIAEHVPVAPPRDWFSNPGLTKTTPITVDDSGHVFGHIASWDMDHIGMHNRIKPPRSSSGYKYFQTGVLRTEEGVDVNVGQLTLAGGHADLNFSARDAIQHYDDTASAIADVRAGEDQFGIWVAGGLRPGVSPEQVRVLRASAPSGDWRPIKGKLELVAVCQVNVPGFPIARTLVAGGQTMAIVAAGAYTMAQMKTDPIADMSARLEKLEQFTAAEIDTKVSPLREKFAQARADRDATLAQKAEDLSMRVAELSDFTYIPVKTRKSLAAKGQALPDGSYPIRNVNDLHNAIRAIGRAKDPDKVKEHIKKRAHALGASRFLPADWKKPVTASAADTIDLRARIEQFSASQIIPTTPLNPSAGDVVTNPDGTSIPGASADPKFSPETQPRESNGKYSAVLARLQDPSVGVGRGNGGTGGSGGAATTSSTVGKQAAKIISASSGGDAKGATLGAANLVNTLNTVNTKGMSPKGIAIIKETSRELSTIIVNSDLSMGDTVDEYHFSDLPPVLQQFSRTLVSQVQQKVGAKKAVGLTADWTNYMSGQTEMTVPNISSALNKLLSSLN